MKHPLSLTVITILLMLSLVPHAVLAENPTPGTTLELLSQQTDGQLSVANHAVTGKVRFIGTDLNHPIPQPASLPDAATPEDAARQFLSAYGEPFGLVDQAQELQTMRVTEADGGRSFVRFQQIFEGVPVLGGELVVQLNAQKDVLSINGEVLPEIKALSSPSIAPEAAAATALNVIAKGAGLSAADLQVTQPELWYYNPQLLGGPGLPNTRLAWRMEVQAIDLRPVKELVLVDAQLGMVMLHFSEIDAAMYRKIYDNANNRSAGLPGTGPVRVEGQPPSAVTDVNLAYDYAGDVYNFYLNTHGRDSLDGAGMQLISTVRYCDSDTSTSCPYDNAFWNGSQMVYGQGYAADDVVAHEMTHAVTDYESRLFYYMQSGAINESFSDIWGEFVDLSNGRGTDTPGVRWLMGEDLPIGAIRSMSNPPAYGDPDRVGSSNYWCNTGDGGGVHINSGVSNKAAFLITDGGVFNGTTVTGLGITKAAKIYYEVQTNLLTSASDFADLHTELYQACLNLVGTNGITASDCLQVANATDAVEMADQPASCAVNEAPVCPSGQTAINLFYDDLENPSSGRWTKSTSVGSNVWYYPQNPNPYWDPTYATSGVTNFWGYDSSSKTDSVIRMTNGVSLPTGSNVYMRFNHAYSFEAGGSSYFDGGVVEYSTNGTTWTDAGSLFTHNGYRGTLSSSFGNPLGGRQAFSSLTWGYYSSRLLLNSLAGQTVRFRFRIGTDTSYDDYGWWLDDIRIYRCTNTLTNQVFLPMVMRDWPALPATPHLNTISNDSGSSDYDVTWDAATYATGYVLMESLNVPSISSASQVYSGNATSWSASGKAAGTYYYWVKATNTWGASGWSNMESTVVLSNPVQNPGFEQGPLYWTEYSYQGWDLIINSGFPGSVSPHTGSWAVWEGGDYYEVSYIQQAITIPGSTPYLAYWHWIASSDACGYDYGGVIINGSTVVDSYTLCSSTNTEGWVKHVVNLGAYAGQTVQVQIRCETDGSYNSNLFIDDVAFQATSAVEAAPGAPIFTEDGQMKSTRLDLVQGGPASNASERLLGLPLPATK